MNVYPYDGRKPRPLKPDVSRLGEELMRVNGHAAPGVIDLALYRTPRQPGPRLPDDFCAVDMRAFVERVRALATQI